MLVALMVESMLSDLGHDVFATAANLGQASEMAANGMFDCAILDVNINGEEVYPVADALAARGIPFAFSTGYGQRNLPDRYSSRPLLGKPIEQNDLERAIREITGSDGESS